MSLLNKLNPSSTRWGKTRKEIIEKLLDEDTDAQTNLELKEIFFRRKVALGDKNWEIALGQTQGELKITKEMIKFLEEEYKELK